MLGKCFLLPRTCLLHSFGTSYLLQQSGNRKGLWGIRRAHLWGTSHWQTFNPKLVVKICFHQKCPFVWWYLPLLNIFKLQRYDTFIISTFALLRVSYNFQICVFLSNVAFFFMWPSNLNFRILLWYIWDAFNFFAMLNN